MITITTTQVLVIFLLPILNIVIVATIVPNESSSHNNININNDITTDSSIHHPVLDNSGSTPSTVTTTTARGIPKEEEIQLQVTYNDGRILTMNEGVTESSRSTSHEDDNSDDSIPFLHFTAHNRSMTCTSDTHARPFNNQIRGVNLGGYMVLEPWITPSLFYQFLNQLPERTAYDMYSFCQVLGPVEANQQLRRHWDTWITEEIIQQLAESGAVNSFRLPVGDFQFVPYGPYEACVEGGLDYIDQVLDWSYANGITVLIDVHTAIGSQNGFDNSGQALGFAWTTALSSEYVHDTTFEHWPIRTAEWVGTFDPLTASYTSINYTNIQHSLQVIREIVY